MDAFDIFTDIENRAKAYGITLTEAGRAVNIDPGLISKWRYRQIEPRLSTLNRLLNSLTTLADMYAKANSSPIQARREKREAAAILSMQLQLRNALVQRERNHPETEASSEPGAE